MEITILGKTITLVKKVNVFVPHFSLDTTQCYNLEKDLLHSGLVRLQTFENQHPVRRKESFLNSRVNKEVFKRGCFSYTLTLDPLIFLFIPTDFSIWKISEDGIENLDHIEVKNLTPNTILTSPIFDFDDLISDGISLQDLRSEDDYKEIVFEKILDKKLEEMAQRKEDRFNQLFNPEKL